MAEWMVNRSFDYDSVNLYYTHKITAFPTSDLLNLPAETFTTINDLGKHLRNTAATIGLELPACNVSDMYTWGNFISNLPSDKQYNAWKYREYVFGCTMLFVAGYVSDTEKDHLMIGSSEPRILHSDFKISDYSFSIVGSSTLTSDIDITIQGPHAAFLISVIEDLFIILTTDEGIPIRCWDVEFYGDFKLLQSMFVNFSKFRTAHKMLLLSYALVSYYRSTHQVANSPPTIHPNVEFLVRTCLKMLGTPDEKMDNAYKGIVNDSYKVWRTTAPLGRLNREKFYSYLGSVENDSSLIQRMINMNGIAMSDNTAMRENGIDVEGLAFTLFYNVGHGNIHRAESYVLPSTAVHVVEFEQKKAGASTLGLPETWFSSNARIGIDKFGYLLSAIEQLGYLEHYHPSGTTCNKKGIKYFGRYVRALVLAGLLPEDSQFTTIYKQLNVYRSKADTPAVCDVDIPKMLEKILNELRGMSGGSRRRRRKTRKHRRHYHELKTVRRK